MLSSFPFAELEKKLGYTFKNRELLQTAFTHSSYAAGTGGESNERLEYLGDAVLELIVSETLYLRGDGMTHGEGEMTEMRKKRVMNEALAVVVSRCGLEKYLLFCGKSENNVGKKAGASLFEAVTAAIYLDGGYEAAKLFVLERQKLLDLPEETGARGQKDNKTRLKEILEKRKPPLSVEYAEVGRTGADHAPRFTVEARADGMTAVGTGGSLRAAEQDAAGKMLERLEE